MRCVLLAFFTAATVLSSLPAQADAPVTVDQPWMRYLLPSLPAAGYMVLRNSSDVPQVLKAAASPACGMLMLHQSQDASGMSMMNAVQSVSIPAHGSVALAPGGFHLMCMAPKMRPGDQVPVTLSFAGGWSLKLTLPVYGAQNAP